jgi:hypothetical protein
VVCNRKLIIAMQAGRQKMANMARFKKMPYLLFVAVLQFGLYCCLTVIYGGIVYGDGVLFRPGFGRLLLPALLLVSLYGFIRALLSLRAKGLNYSATVGEFEEARNLAG